MQSHFSTRASARRHPRWIDHLKFGFILLIATAHSLLAAESPPSDSGFPPEAQAFLQSLPGQTLSVETVITRARRSSESYAGIEALTSSLEASVIRASGIYRPRFSLDVFKGKNQLEPRSPFEPDLIETEGLRLGASQSLLTGTDLDLGAFLGRTGLGFPPNPAATIPNFEFGEGRFDLTIRQHLLKNSFGQSARLAVEAGNQARTTQSLQKREELETWTLTLLDQYYQAWLAQSRVRTAQESVERRKRLLRITRIRLSRGTAERPDLLEAEGSLTSAEIELRRARETLNTVWLALGTTLDLSEAIRSIDPLRIPLSLDEVEKKAADVCATTSPAVKTGSAARARATAELASLEEKRAESDHSVDLQVRAVLASNGIDGRVSRGLSESTRIQHPSWELGLHVEWPLGMTETRARLLEARTAQIRASTQATLLEERDLVNRITYCEELKRRQTDVTELRENMKRQSDRARLEEQRFSIGRIRLNDVTRAEDDQSFSETRLQEEEIALRRVSWRLMELAGRIPEWLEALP